MKKDSVDRLKVDAFFAVVTQYPEYFGGEGSESVRTTLKLSEKDVEAKEWLADRWSTTQKDVVDSACPYAMVIDRLREQFGPLPESEPIRKTHVLSSGTLKIFELQADELGLSRDELLDQTLILLRAREEQADQERLEKHRESLDILEQLANDISRSLDELEELVGKGDPVRSRVVTLDILMENLIGAVHNELDGGDPVHPDDMSQAYSGTAR